MFRILNTPVAIDSANYAGATANLVVNVQAGTATGEGSDTLSSIENVTGGSGQDVLTGNGDANVLLGGNGLDTLSGAGGNDRLGGGFGADMLSGGAGSDTFVFERTTDSSRTAFDTITDFTTNVDKIDLSAIDADNDAANGHTTFTFKSVFTLPTKLAQGCLYYDSGSNVLAADTSGDGLADLKVQFTGSSTDLDRSDLIGLAPSAALRYEGVNLPSGGFGVGNLGIDYIYPDTSDIDYFTSKGMNLFRVGFRAANLTGSPTDTANDFAALDRLVAHAAQKGAVIELAMMDFGYTATGQLIGSTPESVAQFAAQWRSIADHFKNAPNVMFNLMNEPHAQTAPQWFSGAQAAVNAIREVGANQKVIVPGSYWDHAQNWVESGNAATMIGLRDPADNVAFEVHYYFSGDWDNLIPSPTVDPAKELANATQWARTNNVEMVLGEWGFANNLQATAAGEAVNDFIHQNKDVWVGGTYWAGGPWWRNYPFDVQPTRGPNGEWIDKPQMAVLTEYLDTVAVAQAAYGWM